MFYTGLAVCCHALELNCTPGALRSLAGDPSSVTTLTVRGSVDASDLFFIAEEMNALRSLDLSGSTIAASTIISPSGVSRTWPSGMIPDGVFAASGLEEIVLPAVGTLYVGPCAFMGSKLKKLDIVSGEYRFGEAAFAGCDDMQTVRISAASTSEGYLFHRCKSLISADISGFTSVSVSDFADCTSLRSVCSTESLVSIGRDAFARTALQEIDLSEAGHLGSIGDRAFYGDTALIRVILSANSDIALGEGVFFGCTAMQALTLPSRLSVIPDYALADTRSLTSLALPSSLRSIGNSAMANASSLGYLDARGIKEVPATEADVWRGVDQPSAKLHVDLSVAELFRSAPQWKEFDIITVATSLADVRTGNVSARFEDKLLVLSSVSSYIETATLYDLGGAVLLRADIGMEAATLDTSSCRGNIFIVQCSLADGSTASFKLLRNN